MDVCHEAGVHRTIAAVSTGRRIVVYSVHLDPEIVCGYFYRGSSISINGPAKTLKLYAGNFPCSSVYVACEEGHLEFLLYFDANDENPLSSMSMFRVEGFPREVFALMPGISGGFSVFLSQKGVGF